MKQLQIALHPQIYDAIERIAEDEHQSISQVIEHLLEEQVGTQKIRVSSDDVSAEEIGTLAATGGAFDWLADEPDLYDDACGEPA